MVESIPNWDGNKQRLIEVIVDRENNKVSGKEAWKWHAMNPSPVKVYRNSLGETEDNWELIAQNDIGDYLVWQYAGIDENVLTKKVSGDQLELENKAGKIVVHPNVDVRRFYENVLGAEQRKIPILSEATLETIAVVMANTMVKDLLIAFPDVVDILDTKSDLDAQCRSKIIRGYVKDVCLRNFENPLRLSHAPLREADEAYLRDLRLRIWDTIEKKIEILFHKEREQEIKKPNGVIDQFCEEVGESCGYKAYSEHPNPFENGLDIEEVLEQLSLQEIEKRKKRKDRILYVFGNIDDAEYKQEKFRKIIDKGREIYRQLTEDEN